MFFRPTLIALMLLFLSPPSFALDATWVEVEGKAEITGNLTPEKAKVKALNQARSRAIEQVVGIEVSDEAYFGRSGEGSLKLFRETKAITWGRVVEEKDLRYSTENVKVKPEDSPIIFIKVRLRARVAKDNPPDPNFKVSLKLNRHNFNEGAPLKMDIRSTQDGYLSVFNLAANDRVYVIYPNGYRQELAIAKNVGLELPKADDPFSIRPAPLEGHEMDVEAVKVIATRSKLDLPRVDEKNGSLSMADFYRWLLSIPAAERAEATEEYRVHSSK
ncbi:MAG TPA: hypothetical protein DD435_16020 [Cyanobacteria bacterium UBA8530]|nr:hypothetical protein [Cyanobacteria bacterium UBA8530]